MSFLILLAAASELIAEADLTADKAKWTGRAQINLASATGNTENTVFGGRFNIAGEFGAITHDFEAGGNYTETTTQDAMGEDLSSVTQNLWFAQYRVEVQTAENTFVYGRTRYEEDQFSGFDRRAFIGGGLGYTLVENDIQKLTLLVGPGVQYFATTRPDPLPEDFERDQTSFAVFFGESYSRTIAENISLEQSLDATFTDANSTLANTISLNSNLTEKISLQTSYNIKHETDPPEGREATDTLLSVAVAYTF